MRAKTAIALVSTAGGLGCVVGAGYEGLHYSSWANPGALNTMVQLGGAALVLFAVPAAMVLAWFFRQLRDQARSLGLSPAESAVIQFAVMEAAHHEWARHNREWSERLTESVMGRERDWQQWQ
jgi:hypothetical protein